jgi:hypothetical protein
VKLYDQNGDECQMTGLPHMFYDKVAVNELLQANASTAHEQVSALNARVAELHRIVATLWNDVDPADYEDIREAVMVELAQRTEGMS